MFGTKCFLLYICILVKSRLTFHQQQIHIITMTNEELSEYYGFKAHEYGFFELWREKTHDYMKQNPKSDRSEVYGRFFIQLFDEKNQPPSKRVVSI